MGIKPQLFYPVQKAWDQIVGLSERIGFCFTKILSIKSSSKLNISNFFNLKKARRILEIIHPRKTA